MGIKSIGLVEKGICMRNLVIILASLLLLSCVSGCGITIVPRPLAPTDTVNLSDRSITINNETLTLSARVQDTAVGGYSLVPPLTSFYITALNKGRKPVVLSQSSFLLFDDQEKLYHPVAPATVKALLFPDFDFLQPFPYVSILNSAEQENQRAASGMASERPYIGKGLEPYPAGVPFQDSEITAGGRASGVVFFEVDLTALKLVRLQVSDPVNQSVFVFPFAIQ